MYLKQLESILPSGTHQSKKAQLYQQQQQQVTQQQFFNKFIKCFD